MKTKAKGKAMPVTKKKTAVKKTTLRSLLSRIKGKCDLIIAEGQRYWSKGLAKEMDDWRFEVTEDELRLIEGVWENRIVNSFGLNFTVKVGKKSVRVVGESGSVALQFISLNNLVK
jgi:hypothetical protein